MRGLATVEGEMLQQLQEAENLFCFLDYDGTLAPLAPTPDEAVPLPGTTDLLRALAAARGTQVAIVSGRMIDDLQRFIDVAGIHYVGIHGLEFQRPDGRRDLASGAGALWSHLPAIKGRIEQDLRSAPGILIESKGAALACHYRLASRVDAVRARQTVSRVARTYQRRGVPLAVLFGHEVAEIRPANINKGTAVAALLAASAVTALPLYIGDDRTDEDAFAILPPEAITIHVGSPDDQHPARYSLPDPFAVHAFLAAVVRCRVTPTTEE